MSAVNRDTKTSSALIALARARRMQRALAHAALHRNTPLPTLRSSLGYITTTARVTEDATVLGHPSRDSAGPDVAGPLPHRSLALGHPSGVSSGQGVARPLPHDRSLALGHRMTVLGISRFDGVAYVIEEIGADDAPIVYRLYLRGPRQGHLVPLRAWYEHSENVGELRARIAALASTLEPVLSTACEPWMLSTRIVQRRALRVAGPSAGSELPIRKFTLQLVVEPVSGIGTSGRSTVTAFLSPHAQLTEVWSLASRDTCDAAIARVTFTGIPSGTGLTKDTVILLTSGLYGFEDPEQPVGSARQVA
jgi:hypothetical protein